MAIYLWSLCLISGVYWSDYSDLTTIGKPFPLISGKLKLVKYYDLARFFERWQLFDIHIFGEIIFFKDDLGHVTTKTWVLPEYKCFFHYGPTGPC